MVNNIIIDLNKDSKGQYDAAAIKKEFNNKLKEVLKNNDIKTLSSKELKRIQDIKEKNKSSLEMYFDYNDSLSEKDILKIITSEEGLNDIKMELYENNLSYISETISNIIRESCTEEELNKDLFIDTLREELEGAYSINIKALLRYSSARLRITLLCNEDAIYMPGIKESECFKLFKKAFKGCYNKKELDAEVLNMMGSDYSHITFYFKVSGQNILNLREQYLKGNIELKEGSNFGLFNYWVGAGSILECKTTKNINLNVKNWTNDLIKSEYYPLKLCLDSEKYGIQETYNLTGEGWREF